MQRGHLLELGQGETFFARILWMQTPGQLGGLEPEAQGFGIHPEREATLRQRDKHHDGYSFHETHRETRHTRILGASWQSQGSPSTPWDFPGSAPRECWETFSRP